MKFSWGPAVAAARKRKRLVQQSASLAESDDAAPDNSPPSTARVVVEPSGAPGVNHQPSFLSEDGDASQLFPGEAFAMEHSRKGEASRILQLEGNQLAESGDFPAALAKWSKAIALTPGRAALQESMAQVLMEIGETWQAVQAATRATELEPQWAEGWITLSRAQLNLGEPHMALESASKATRLAPENVDARHELETAQHLVAKQRQVDNEHDEDVTKLASCGVAASRIRVHKRVCVLEGRSGSGRTPEQSCRESGNHGREIDSRKAAP